MLRNIHRKFAFHLQTNLLINNKFVNSTEKTTFPTFNPTTEEQIAEVQLAGDNDVADAVSAARSAFDRGPWRFMSGRDRGKLLNKLADLIEKHAKDLARAETIDSGKPIHNVMNIDIPLSVSIYRYYAGLANNIKGTTIPIHGNYACYTRKEPIGVAAQIIPWNFPILMQAWKLSQALAAGCTVVLKPAEQTPLSALLIGELIVEAGFPPGVVNILPGFGETGESLVLHPDVDKIAFTGSTEVGHKIIKMSGNFGLKRVSLELGGKSPQIIFDDADINNAVTIAHNGLFFNQGQCCNAASRIYVQDRIYNEFVELSVKSAENRVLGDPLKETTEHGPMVDEIQFNKVLTYIEKGKTEGATLLTGGKRTGKKGYFIEPTIFVDVTDDMTIAKEEIFGPVMCIMKFKTIDEAIVRANKTQYGLVGGVLTQDIDKAIRVSNEIKAGTIYVNCYGVTTENTPFGGYKESGIGRELGEEGLQNYLETKTVIIQTPKNAIP